MRNDLRILRRDIDSADDAAQPRRYGGGTGAPTIFGPVVDGGDIPIGVPDTFLITPSTITFPLKEGAAFTVTPISSNRECVTVIGPGVPKAGDYLTARLAPGSRWLADYPTYQPKGRCCDCIPTKFILDSDLSVKESNLVGLFGFLNSDEAPIEFEWQPSPIQVLGVNYDFGEPYVGAITSTLTYTNLAPMGWFSKSFPGKSGTASAYLDGDHLYWLTVSGCGLAINVIGLTAFTATGSVVVDGAWQRKSISAQGWIAHTNLLGGPTWAIQAVASGLADCNNVNIRRFVIPGIQYVISPGEILFTYASDNVTTDALDLVGGAGYGYGAYYGKCVSRDEIAANTTGPLQMLTGIVATTVLYQPPPGLGPLCLNPPRVPDLFTGCNQEAP